MPPSLLHDKQDTFKSNRRTLLTILLLVTSVVAYVGTPVKHSLLTSAVAWTWVWLYARLKTTRVRRQHGVGQRLGLCAGGLLALSQICERAVEGKGIWWANGLLPLTVYLFLRSEIIGGLEPENVSRPATPDKTSPPQVQATNSSKSALAVLTCSAVLAIFTSIGSHATIALGLSYTILVTLAFFLVEKASIEARNPRQNGTSVIYSANGLLSQPLKPAGSGSDTQMVVVRNVFAAAALSTTIAAFSLESFDFGGLAYWGIIGQAMGDHWVFGQGIVTIIFGVLLVGVHSLMNWVLLVLIQRQGTFHTSFVPLFVAIASQLISDFSLSRIWFAVLCGASAITLFSEQTTLSGANRGMRLARLLTLVAVVSLAVLTFLHLREPYKRLKWDVRPDITYDAGFLEPLPPPEPLSPKAFPNTHEHPISQLVHDAESSWQQLVEGQSPTLEAAVEEYKRRYGIPPPPNFDNWYTFARLKGVQLIDEFDTIYKSLLPFWGISPATTRARAREAIGYRDNNLLGLAIRDGKASIVTGGQEWMQQAIVGMIQQFVQYLPDMDIAFNTHDEPRVVVPHDDLSRLVQIALDESMPAALKNPSPRNSFSPRPEDVNSGQRFAECKTTRFNWYAHQAVWDPSRISCPPDTPSRALDETMAPDNLTAYALGDLGFIYNQTAFSDICNSPSLATTFGFFDRPNAFNTVHDLFPIFSQSKVSSFQDILYPSPWYWDEKVAYENWKDLEWNQKIPKLFWRGSTTGGFSRNGGWRRQHRQHLVKRLNALDEAKILQDTTAFRGMDPTAMRTPEYETKKVPRQDFEDSIDVHFSHIGQCDPGDCDAQKEFFSLADNVAQQDHWKWKYLLDMDGNAFSGRFYAFLKSKSLVFKMSIFREWHQEWLRPWVHYVPLSLRGDEALESVRYFSTEGEGGKDLAARLADQGREWANKALRNEDFEVWFFRVLLEYGRIVDDARAEIGYSGS